MTNMTTMTTILLLCVLSTLANIPSLLLRVVPFKEKISRTQGRALLLWYTVGLAADFGVCLWAAQCGTLTIAFYKVQLLVFCVVMGAVNMLVLRGYAREHLFTFGLTALVVWLILAVSAFITGQIGYSSVAQALIIVNAIGLGLYTVLYGLLRQLMLRTVTPFLNIDSGGYWGMIWFIPIAMFFSGLLSHGMNEYTETPLDLLSRLLLGAATLALCHSIAMDYARLLEQQRMNRQIEMQKRYYDALTQAVQNEREVRHNFKHQLAALRGFLQTGNKAELERYCEDLEDDLGNIAEIPYTGNAAADGVLYHYACAAKRQGVRFTTRCTLKDLPLPDTDLCCLLGNALDNALAASAACEGERYITVASECSDGMLLLTVDNSFDGVLLQERGRILSRKRDHAEGIGLATMRRLCEKYGGTSRFEAQGQHFEASFLLQL